MNIIITESQFKNLISNQEISEDITSGSFIVYHRTGKGGNSPIKGIASDGYRVGSGAMYGIGVYTTYNLESQLSQNMTKYGSIVIESKILSIQGFLIFDYNIAKRIYGNNYKLKDQLKLILGNKEWKKYETDKNLQDLLEKVGMTKYTADVAYPFTDNYQNIVRKLRGIIFTGSNDGNVLVCYDRGNIEPLRYTTDNGKTWTNIIDKNIYKRLKGYKPEERNTEHQHTLNKMDTSGVIDLEDFKTLPLKIQNEFIYNKIKSNRRFDESLFDVLPTESKRQLTKTAIDTGYQMTDKMFETLSLEEKIENIFNSLENKDILVSPQRFKLLPEDVQIQYVNVVVRKDSMISHDIFKLFPEKAKRIYINAQIKRGHSLTPWEIINSTPKEQSEYVDTMIKLKKDIDDYGFEKLLPELQTKYVNEIITNNPDMTISQKKIVLLSEDPQVLYITNLVKREFSVNQWLFERLCEEAQIIYVNAKIKAGRRLEYYEWKHFDSEEEQKELFVNYADGNNELPDSLFVKLSPELQLKYVINYINNKNYNLLAISKIKFEVLPEDLKIQYINKVAHNIKFTSNDLFNLFPEEAKRNYIKTRIKLGYSLSGLEILKSTEEEQIEYIDKVIKNKEISDDLLTYFKPEIQSKYVLSLINNDNLISLKKFNLLPNDVKIQYSIDRLKNNKHIHYEMVKFLPDDLRYEHFLNRIKNNRYYDYDDYSSGFIPEYNDIKTFSEEKRIDIIQLLGEKGAELDVDFYKKLSQREKMVYYFERWDRSGESNGYSYHYPQRDYFNGLSEKNKITLINDMMEFVISNNFYSKFIDPLDFKLLSTQLIYKYVLNSIKNPDISPESRVSHYKTLPPIYQTKILMDLPENEKDIIYYYFKFLPETYKLAFCLKENEKIIKTNDNKSKNKYMDSRFLSNLSKESQKMFVEKTYNLKGMDINPVLESFLSRDMKDTYVLNKIKEKDFNYDWLLYDLSPEIQSKAVIELVSAGERIQPSTMNELPQELINKIVLMYTEKGYNISDKIINTLPPELQKQVKINMEKKGWNISLESFKKLGADYQYDIINHLRNKNKEVPDEFIQNLHPELLKYPAIIEIIRKKEENKSLNESYDFKNLSDNDKDQIYNMFKSSYEKSLGTSWSKDKFYGRANNWLFFGDMNGFIAVRPQKSGFYKLVGVGGNLKSIILGLDEIRMLNVPVWGMVSSDIQKMANKKGFKTPPAFLLKILYKMIPDSIFGGVDFDINSDGSLTMKYQDVGDSKKYFIGNEEYFKKLKSGALPALKDKLKEFPLIVRKGVEMFFK